jgi:hypothetical protein
VTLTASNEVAEFTLTDHGPRRIAIYPTVRQPDSVEVDPRDGAIFIAGRTGGQIERIVPGQGAER